MTPKEIAIALAAVTVVADLAKEQKDYLRAQLQQALEDLGADSVRAELPDGTRIARSSLTGGGRKASVSSESDLLAHVTSTRPDEVIVRVRESYRKHLLDSVVEGPDGTAVDPGTGEIVPGITFQQATPYIATRFELGGRQQIAQAIADGIVAYTLPAPAVTYAAMVTSGEILP